MVGEKLTFLQADCGDPDYRPLTAASALGLYYLPAPKSWTKLIKVRKKLTFCKQTVETLIRRR